MSAHRHLPRLWDTGCKAEAWTSPPGPGLCMPANVRWHTRKMLMLVRSAECFVNGARVFLRCRHASGHGVSAFRSPVIVLGFA
jgi:hypothetical protein